MKNTISSMLIAGMLLGTPANSEESRESQKEESQLDIMMEHIKDRVKADLEEGYMTSGELMVLDYLLDDEDLKELIGKKKVDPNKTTRDGDSIFKRFCKSGDIEAMKMIIAQGADINKKSGKYEETPLNDVIYGKNLAAVKLLVESGADLSIESFWGTYLHYAILYGNEEIFDYLLSRGMNPKKLSHDNDSLLITAVNHHKQEFLEKIIGLGADVNEIIYDGGYKKNAISYSIGGGKDRLTRSLLDNGALIDFEHSPYSMVEFIDNAWFINHPTWIKDEDENGKKLKEPIIVHNDHAEGLKLLKMMIGKGGDIFMKDRFGNDALGIARFKLEISEKLIKNAEGRYEIEDMRSSIKILKEVISILEEESAKHKEEHAAIIAALKKRFPGETEVKMTSKDTFTIRNKDEVLFFVDRKGNILADRKQLMKNDSVGRLFRWGGFGYSTDSKGDIFKGYEGHTLYPKIHEDSYEYYLVWKKVNTILN